MKEDAHLKPVLQNHGAKHGFVVPWNTDINVRIGVHAACREPQLFENPSFNALYIKAGLHTMNEAETERFRGSK